MHLVPTLVDLHDDIVGIGLLIGLPLVWYWLPYPAYHAVWYTPYPSKQGDYWRTKAINRTVYFVGLILLWLLAIHWTDPALYACG